MLPQIMAVASQNAMLQFNVLNQVTQNVANLNTTGYKSVRFEQYLQPQGRMEGQVVRDTSPGDRLITRREMDVAIVGHGYFPVTQSDGKVAYTRDGSFRRDRNGYLVTQRGDLVGSGIPLPPVFEHIKIDQQGIIRVIIKNGDEPQRVGELSLVTFTNPEKLEPIGGNKVIATEASGKAILYNNAQFEQGKLERANVSIPMEIDQTLRLNASMISNFRMIKFGDDLFRQAVNLRQ